MIYEYIWNYLVIPLNTLQTLRVRMSGPLPLLSQTLLLYSEGLPLSLSHTSSKQLSYESVPRNRTCILKTLTLGALQGPACKLRALAVVRHCNR